MLVEDKIPVSAEKLRNETRKDPRLGKFLRDIRDCWTDISEPELKLILIELMISR